MNNSNFQQSNHILIILKIAVCSRLVLLALIILWRSLFEPYDTSAPLNPDCLSLESQPADTVLWPKIGSAIEGSIVWDAVYFVRIAQCGYEYEQSYAFLPLLPICISLLSRTGLINCLIVSLSRFSIYSWIHIIISQKLETRLSWMNYGINDLKFAEFGFEFVQQSQKVWRFWIKWRIRLNEVHFLLFGWKMDELFANLVGV